MLPYLIAPQGAVTDRLPPIVPRRPYQENLMHATQQRPTGPNPFKPSLLAWRASYLAGKAAGGGPDTGTAGLRHRVLKLRRHRRAVGR
jgi:hypothetical protein